MSTHGGPREGAGRPSQYTDENGNPLPTKTLRVPAILSKKDIERLAREKLKEDSAKEE